MVIQVPQYLTKTFLHDNRHKYKFIFSGCLWEVTYFGQSAAAQGVENCYQVPTKMKNCKNGGYWNDLEMFIAQEHITNALQRIPHDDRPIILFPKIGLGCAHMNANCPSLLAWLQAQLVSIAYPNIERIK